MVKRLATSSHDPLGITDSACKNQLVVVSLQYGPFNTYIPIRSTTIGKSRVARDPITMHTSWRSNSDIASVTSHTHLPKIHPVLWPEIYHTIVSSDSIGYPRMKASGESSTTKHRLLHASGPHLIPPPNDPNTRSVLGKCVYLVTLAMSLFDLQDVCIAIGSIATLDLPMVVDLIGIYGLKGPYCTLTTTKWFLQTLSVIPWGSWGDGSYGEVSNRDENGIEIPDWNRRRTWRRPTVRMNTRGTCALAAHGWAPLLAIVARWCTDVRRRAAHGTRALAARFHPSYRALAAQLTRRRPACCAPLAARLR
ncbi:glutamate receptor 1.2-like [Dorcoceras hygrometricum]|uniref:Glutamate receptor 1.2-like n=1 Tax=Dorcoceras hygrometricum TaxID=472368 RepID=A0A2Z7CWS0_9LAMI|nr:glutamate receptor 1.2-like [Dorcoceras hygrometricum]